MHETHSLTDPLTGVTAIASKNMLKGIVSQLLWDSFKVMTTFAFTYT